jgi:hypothetical protein
MNLEAPKSIKDASKTFEIMTLSGRNFIFETPFSIFQRVSPSNQNSAIPTFQIRKKHYLFDSSSFLQCQAKFKSTQVVSGSKWERCLNESNVSSIPIVEHSILRSITVHKSTMWNVQERIPSLLFDIKISGLHSVESGANLETDLGPEIVKLSSPATYPAQYEVINKPK